MTRRSRASNRIRPQYLRWKGSTRFVEPQPVPVPATQRRRALAESRFLLVARAAAGLGHPRRPVTYRVLDAAAPVSGAKVTAGRVHRTTGATGLVTLTLKGSTDATATKQGYIKARV